jgi:hypothetical protein
MLENSFSTAFSLGIVDLPIPCRASISFSVNPDNCLSVLIPFEFNARNAGALNKDKKPAFGFLSFSQMGQVGQSVLL